MQRNPKMDLVLNLMFVVVSWLTSIAFDQPACWLAFSFYTGYLLFRIHNYAHMHLLSDTLKPFPMLNINSSVLTLLLVTFRMQCTVVYVFLSTDILPEDIVSLHLDHDVFVPFFTLMIAQFLYINFTFSTNMFAEQIASYQVALTRNYPQGTKNNGDTTLVWTLFASIGLIMAGLGMALMFNYELMFMSLYMLVEITNEWYQFGPSWFRRKMIAMDFVLHLLGIEDESTDGEDKTRMTLKEFMLSDSQRAQIEQIDWEKDITS
jgi:hypothetical protein